MKFTDVCIFIENMSEMVDFYEKVFQIQADKDKVHSVLQIHGLTVALYDKKHAEEVMSFDFSDSGHGMNYIGFNVKDLDAEYKRLCDLDIDNMSEPTLWPWGAKSFNILDPEGNRIMLRSYIE